MRYASICMLLLILSFSCSKPQQNIEFKVEVNEKLNIIERGAALNNEREGYWITFSDEEKIITECYYIHGKLNGPIKLYADNGKIMSTGYMLNDSNNGLWLSYHKNGNLQSKGTLNNGERIGIWEFYYIDGNLDKKVLYEHQGNKVLIDNHLSLDPPWSKSH